jgi:antirestriction protein
MESPRIYVASLSDYNNGRLEGKWFDFDDYSDASELMDAITDMLDEITKKYNDGEEREEWAVHDYEYIPSTLATEYMGERDFQTIYDIVEASEENGIPTEVLMERVGDTGSDDYRSIAESLMFVVDGNDESDIVYELEEQIGELGFDFWQNHIYIDDVTQRVMYGEDVDRYREDIQYDNPDIDEDEVERLAEEQADDEENRRNDDLIGYLEEMGYEDIPTWVSKDYESAWKSALSYDYDIISYDGKMYVFSINYSQGGNVMYNNGGGVPNDSIIANYYGYKAYNLKDYEMDNLRMAYIRDVLEPHKEKKKLDNINQETEVKVRLSDEYDSLLKQYGSADIISEMADLDERDGRTDGEMKKEWIDYKWRVYPNKFNNGGQVQISEEDLAKIRQVVAEEQAKNKGFLGRMQDNYLQSQVSPKEAMQFVKDNPEVLKLLMVLEKGGKVDSENYEMLRGKIKELMHHAKELKSITNRKKQVPAWVLAKSTRASTDLSDITHYMDGNKFGKGGGVESKIDMLYEKSNFINADFNWQGKLIEMLQDNSIEAYNIYQSLTKEQKESVLQEQYELDNDMGSDGDGEIETSKENLEILLQDAKNGNKYANGGGVDYKEQQINDLNNWDNHEIANFLGVSVSQVAKDRQRYIREAQSVMMLDSYSNGGGVDDLKNSLKNDFSFTNLFLPNERPFFLKGDTKVIQNKGMIVITDGNREIIFSSTKPYSKLKKLGNASSSTKELFNKKYSNGGGISRFNEGDKVTNKRGKNRGVGFIVTMKENDSALVDFVEEGKSEWVLLTELKKVHKYLKGDSNKGRGLSRFKEGDKVTNKRGKNRGVGFIVTMKENDSALVDFEEEGKSEWVLLTELKKLRKFDGGGITDYNWANEFRKTKKYFVVILAEENGEEEIFEGNVQARSESEALSEARRGFEFNYPNKMIKKASIDKTKDTNRYEEGGNVSGLNDLIYG